MSSSPPNSARRWLAPRHWLAAPQHWLAALRRWLSGWSLRRRLLVGVLTLLAIVCVAIGAVSTVLLRQSLFNQVDRQLSAAAQRAQGQPGHGPGRGPELFPPGQGVGTVTAVVTPGQVTDAQFLGSSRVPLTDEQTDALLTVPADGKAHTVSVPDLGDYRVVANRGPYAGQVIVTVGVPGSLATEGGQPFAPGGLATDYRLRRGADRRLRRGTGHGLRRGAGDHGRRAGGPLW